MGAVLIRVEYRTNDASTKDFLSVISMLTEDELQNLRRSSVNLFNKGGDGEVYKYADGPLAGLCARLDGTGSTYLHGLSQYTPRGIVVALYTADRKTRRCRFQKFDAPGRGITF